MPQKHLLALVGVTAVAALLRFATLDVQSFWFDEAITVGLLRLDLPSMLAALPDSESTPPLYYVLAWGWAKLFGTGEVGLRSLSALLGTAIVPVGYRAGVELLSRRAGLVTAALLALNPLLVWYSQEARAYALLALLSGMSFMFFASFLKTASVRTLVWWALVSSLALATHYFALFVIVPEAIWLLATRRHRRATLTATVTVGAVALALLPLALVQRSHARTGSITEIPFSERLVDVAKQYVAGFRPPAAAIGLAAALLVFVALLLLIARADERERRAAIVAATIGGAAIAMPLALGLVGMDYFIARNLLAAWLPLTLVVAVGFSVRRAARLGSAAAVAACAAFAVVAVVAATDSKLQRDDWRGAAEALAPASETRAIVVTPGNEAPALETYLPNALTMPPRGTRVREIVLLDVWGREFRPRRPASARPPAAGFREVERRDAETYSLVRFRAAEPVFVSPPRLAAGSESLLSHPELQGRPLIRPIQHRPAVRFTDHPESRPVSNSRLAVMIERPGGP